MILITMTWRQKRYNISNMEKIPPDNQHLVECAGNGSPKPGKDTSPESYENHVKETSIRPSYWHRAQKSLGLSPKMKKSLGLKPKMKTRFRRLAVIKVIPVLLLFIP